jgi:hypothetical protein
LRPKSNWKVSASVSELLVTVQMLFLHRQPPDPSPNAFAKSLIGFFQLHLYLFPETVQTVQALLAKPPLIWAAKLSVCRWAGCSVYAYEGSR